MFDNKDLNINELFKKCNYYGFLKVVIQIDVYNIFI